MFAKMKTGTKVLSGFGIAVVITVIIGLVGYRGITKLNGHVENIGGNQLPSVRAMGELANGHLQVNYALRGLLNKRVTDKARAEQYELVEHGLQQLTEARKMYEGLQRDAKAASLWNEYLLLSENWKKEMQRCVEACREKDRLVSGGAKADDSKVTAIDEQAFQQGVVVRQAMLACDGKLNEIAKYSMESADAAQKQAGVDSSSALTWSTTVIAGGVIVILCFGIFLARSISKVLTALIGEATRLSTAAIEGKLQTRGNPELVSLEFRPIVEGLNETIGSLVGYIDAMPAPAMIIDSEMTIRFMNQVGADVIGLPKEKIVGTKCYNHFKTGDCNTDKCAAPHHARRPTGNERNRGPSGPAQP